MTTVSTHVLDLTRGTPAHDLTVTLEFRDDSGEWQKIASGQTDQDGRFIPPANNEDFGPGVYRLVFNTADYFTREDISYLHPVVLVAFAALPDDQRIHVPLLLSPHGYTTYRGS
jgi:5-hydroxyisourate hydrolase